MDLLDKALRLFKVNTTSNKPTSDSQEALLIQLEGSCLPKAIYDEYDLKGLEEEILDALEESSVGELDGHELTSTGATVYLYSKNAEELFKQLEPVLRSYPLCQQATVILRRGGPGAAQREITL